MQEATAVILDCMAILLPHLIIPQKNPGALCFSKALIEGLISGGAYIRRGLSTEGNLRLKINWASIIVDVNLPFLPFFTFYLRAIFLVTSPRGAYIWRGNITEGFLRWRFGGHIFFRNFTV